MKKTLSAAIILILCVSAPAAGDEVVKKNGVRIRGKVVKQTPEEVVIRVSVRNGGRGGGRMEMRIPVKDIRSITVDGKTRVPGESASAAASRTPARWPRPFRPEKRGSSGGVPRVAESGKAVGGLLSARGLRSGLYVCVGNVPARQAAKVSQGGRNLVHCLLPSEKALQEFRSGLRKSGARRVYGDLLRGGELPYADDLVNVLALEDFSAFKKKGGSVQEILRVVAPEGTVFLGNPGSSLKSRLKEAAVKDVRQSAGLVTLTKAWPEGMDEWTHFEHGAGRTSVSKDTIAGIPKGVRWITGRVWPTWGVFGAPSPTFVSAGGRNFYWYAEGKNKKEWASTGVLICRDAFNGMLLWSRKIRTRVPRDNVIATKDSIIAPYDRALHVLDAATGREKRQIKERGEHVLFDEASGCLAVLKGHSKLKVVDVKTGKRLWEKEHKSRGKYWYAVDRMLIGDGDVFIVHLNDRDAWAISSYDLRTGRENWTASPGREQEVEGAENEWILLTSYADGIILAANGSRRLKFDPKYGQKGLAVNYAIDGKTGRLLGKYAFEATGHGGYATNVYYLDGLVWSKTKEAWVGWDPKTGREKRRTRVAAITRCYPDHVVGGKIMTGKMHFVDIRTGEQSFFQGTRSACGSGFFPANGMIYTLPTRCLCFRMVRGCTALPPTSALAGKAPENELVKGPAYGARAGKTSETDWNTYRANAARGSSTKVSIAARLKTKWEVDFKEQITSPTAAAGMVFVSLLDSNEVVALDANSGEKKWFFQTGGRVDTPPTYYGGLLLFGCADGWVYCLSARDGKLVWKFRAAPADRRIVVREQLESVWPVHGSVLVRAGVAYFAAGRHTSMDDGVFFYAVSPETGRMVWKAGKKAADGYAHCAIPVTDGRTVYFGGRFQFDAKTGKSLPKGTGMTLFAPMGMVTDNTAFSYRGGTDNQRSQWLYADKNGLDMLDSKSSYSRKCVTERGAAGSLLAFDGPDAFGFYQDPGASQTDLFGRHLGKRWKVKLPPRHEVRLSGILLARDKLFVGGITGGEQTRGKLIVFSTAEGKKLGETDLPSGVRWDGLAAAGDRLYVSGETGVLSCLAGK